MQIKRGTVTVRGGCARIGDGICDLRKCFSGMFSRFKKSILQVHGPLGSPHNLFMRLWGRKRINNTKTIVTNGCCDVFNVNPLRFCRFFGNKLVKQHIIHMCTDPILSIFSHESPLVGASLVASLFVLIIDVRTPLNRDWNTFSFTSALLLKTSTGRRAPPLLQQTEAVLQLDSNTMFCMLLHLYMNSTDANQSISEHTAWTVPVQRWNLL